MASLLPTSFTSPRAASIEENDSGSRPGAVTRKMTTLAVCSALGVVAAQHHARKLFSELEREQSRAQRQCVARAMAISSVTSASSGCDRTAAPRTTPSIIAQT